MRDDEPIQRGVILSDLGVLRIRGADGAKFLQGQLSNDTAQLAPGRTLFAGYHNPQGRVIAVLALAAIAPDDLIAVLPRELVAGVGERLRGYVLRSKVALVDESSAWVVCGCLGGAPNIDGAIEFQHTVSRRLFAAPPPTAATIGATAAPQAREAWRALDIADCRPQVYAATREAFVAQMLNLDLLGAIAFDKGCYTGQEVIARAHYRGRVKRRMQRFRSIAPITLRPGDAGRLADGRGFRVVDAVVLADGRSEFLAVTALSAGTGDSEEERLPAGADALACEALPLPYALPSQPNV